MLHHRNLQFFWETGDRRYLEFATHALRFEVSNQRRLQVFGATGLYYNVSTATATSAEESDALEDLRNALQELVTMSLGMFLVPLETRPNVIQHWLDARDAVDRCVQAWYRVKDRQEALRKFCHRGQSVFHRMQERELSARAINLRR